jgi:uncharacterized protein YqjF (DUF2071 family)
MSWHDLLFAHWSFEPSEVSRLLPAGIELDTFQHQAWIGVVPFRMSDVAPRGIPAVPWMSAFPEWYNYSSIRTHRNAPSANFTGRYRPTGEIFSAQEGTLEHWLTARYCLYAADRRGRILRGEIDHPPWPLQRAELELKENSMLESISLRSEQSPHLLFAKDIAVKAWWNELVDRI